MKTMLLAVMAMIPVLSARGESTGQVVQELARTIRDKVPAGWVVTYQSKYLLLEVYRRGAVAGNYAVIPNGLGYQEPHKKNLKGRPSFWLRVKADTSPAEYKRLSTENAPVLKQLKLVTDQLEKRKVPWGKGGDYMPRNDPDKQLVDQYNALKKSLHFVPGYYFQTISLDLESTPDGTRPIDFLPEEKRIREECNRVRDILMKILSKYE